MDLARAPTPASDDEAHSSDLFIPDVDQATDPMASERAVANDLIPNPMASEGTVADDIPMVLGQEPTEGPPADEQPASIDFGLLDLETAGLRRSDRQKKPTWKLADPINKKLKIALGVDRKSVV